MKIFKFIMAVLILLSAATGNAQIKNAKIEKVKISGNCGMCKTTIENAGNLKKQASVNWDKVSKMAIISYDSVKTTKSEILKRIALAGYDNEIFLAPKDTYLALDSCCQYERSIKTLAKIEHAEIIVEKEEIKDSIMDAEIIAVEEENLIEKVYDSYFSLKDALVKTNGGAAAVSAKNLLAAINNVKMDKLSMEVQMVWGKVFEKLKKDAELISKSKNTEYQRTQFMSLSKNLHDVMKVSKQETPTYYQFCPMTNNGKGANWLSKEKNIKNPYYGSKMISCGKTVETIK